MLERFLPECCVVPDFTGGSVNRRKQRMNPEEWGDNMALLTERRLSEFGTNAIAAPQQAQSRQNAGPQYHAFVSYSRAADGRLAPVLQSALQRFAKPWYRRQILRVFRDQTSLE